MIAPKSNGSCEFYIKNESGQNVIYDITFLDEMEYFVNMKYRLKINNVYIRGNEEEYISIDELAVEDIIVVEGAITRYTLEWYWEDDDEADTLVGSQGEQHYTLTLNIQAEQYIGE